MKITDAKVFVCCPGRNFVTLKISTDEGVYGLGDATLNGRELPVASYLADHVIPCIIGRDPFQTEDIWQYLYRGAYWRRGPVTMTAIAAVDMALWDIKGKSLNTPVYNLLGGKSRTGVLVYRSQAFQGCHPHMGSRKTSSFMNRQKRDCLRRTFGRQKNICCKFQSCFKRCA